MTLPTIEMIKQGLKFVYGNALILGQPSGT